MILCITFVAPRSPWRQVGLRIVSENRFTYLFGSTCSDRGASIIRHTFTMVSPEDSRPDPDTLLRNITRQDAEQSRPRLKVFLGMSAGVGKTYAMLRAGHDARAKGIDIAVGYVESHGRKETEALVQGLPMIPRRIVEYRSTRLEEMDLDGVIARHPHLVLVDELAHTNAPGSRHAKRYQDVLELLDNGISVLTTLNVQHLESRADIVAQITGILIRETVPDSILDRIDEVELIDISPDELLKRLAEGKVYTGDRSLRATQNFFRKGNLTALREMALRVTAERVDRQLRDYMQTRNIPGPWKSAQRILVAVSQSPQSAELIRWGRGIAQTMDATWVAVSVETLQTLNEVERAQLEKNLAIARELGAEVVTTTDTDVVRGVLRVAKEQNASQLLVGKSMAKSWLWRKSILDRFLEESGDLDVLAVGTVHTKGVKRRFFPTPTRHSAPLQYLLSALTVAIALLLCSFASPLLGYQSVSFMLLLTVSVLPLFVGLGPVLLAAFVSAAGWDYFFIPPPGTLAVGRPEDMLMLLTYFVVALVAGTLASRNRIHQQAVRQREERATALYALTKDLSIASSKDGVVKATVDNLGRSFNADVVVFLGESDGDISATPHPASTGTADEKEYSVAAWVYWNERKAGRFTDTLPFARATYYPISGPRYSLGVVGLRANSDTPPSTDQEALLVNLLSQTASSLERETLNELTKQAIVIQESERLYKTLFNSISHEMRTPLSAILAATEALMGTSTDGPARKELAEEIHTAAHRMNRLVGNLLDMTRLDSGMIRPSFDWCSVADVVQSAVRKLREELREHTVIVEITESIPLIKADFPLLEQAFTNVLHNGALYTPPGSRIEVRAGIQDDNCVVTIEDNGPGLPSGTFDHIFEKFFRLPGSKAGGTGLGLSIARGFVEAHGGTLTAENRPEGGARFIFRIPIEKSEAGHEP